MENKIYEICHNFKKNVKDIVAGIIIVSFILVFCFVWFFGPGLVFIKICGDEPINPDNYAFELIEIFVIVILPYILILPLQEKIKKFISNFSKFIVNCINA